jgi:hypothetical protein
MKTLIYNNIRRSETDQAVIDNLLRKGWIDATPPQKPALPEQPEYDSSIEYLQYSEETNSYSKIPYTEEELTDADLRNRRENLIQSMNSGFLVQPENFILGLSDADRGAFTQMLSLVKEALDFELITNDTPQMIADINGQKHQINTLRFRQIMVQYGLYYKNLWDSLKSLDELTAQRN